MTGSSYRIRSPWPRRLKLGSSLLLVGVAAVWFAARRSAEEGGVSALVDRVVERSVADEPISGISVAVARGGRTLHSAGYGFADLENQLPATAETVYSVGSITKQFTAAAILQLVDEGELGLEDPISGHLPYGPNYAPGVTIRSLLNHTSGIKNYTTMERWWRTIGVEMTPEEMVAVFQDEPRDFTPGSDFSYTNSGYFLLGLILERVSGQPFGGYLNRNLSVPLDLPSTSDCDDRALVPNRARGYQLLDGEFAHAPYVSMSQAYSAGGVCSNVLDLLQWTRFLSEGAVLGPDGYERMVTPDTLSDGREIEYGYGLAVGFLEGHRRVSHVGATLGFSSFMSHYPDDDLRIAVLSNTEGAETAGIESEIARLLLELGEQSSRDLPLSSEELSVYEGTYDFNLAEVVVTSSDGRLVAEISVPGLEGRYTLLYQGENNFQVQSDSETVARFQLQGGMAQGFVLDHQGITMRGRRISPRTAAPQP